MTVPFVLSCRTVQSKSVHARARRGLTPEFLSRIKRCAQSSPRSKSRSTHRTENAPLVRLFPHHPNVLQRTSKSALACARPGHPSTTHSKHQGRTTLRNKALKYASSPLPYATGTLDWSEAQSFSVKERCRVAGLLNGVRRASVGRPNVWAVEFFCGKGPR